MKREVPPIITLPEFQYIHSSKTDVRKTWIKHGWQPPSREVQQHWYKVLNPTPAMQE